MTHGSYTTYTRQHGSNSTYVQGCRCADCREAARQYLAQYRRTKIQAPTVSRLAAIPDPPERRVTGISGMTGSSVNNSSGVRVRCRCGNSGYANKWIVGKTRRVDSCEACR